MTDDPNAQLIGLANGLEATRRQLDEVDAAILNGPSGDYEALNDKLHTEHRAWWSLMRSVSSVQATNPDGVKAKARLLRLLINEIEGEETEHVLAKSLVSDILGGAL